MEARISIKVGRDYVKVGISKVSPNPAYLDAYGYKSAKKVSCGGVPLHTTDRTHIDLKPIWKVALWFFCQECQRMPESGDQVALNAYWKYHQLISVNAAE